MKRTLLVGAALALAVSACGQQDDTDGDDAPDVDVTQEDPNPEAEPEGDAGGDDQVYVLNLHGDEEGFDDRRPEDYVATEFTTFTDMDWGEWDEERAVGEGEVLGTWCMDQNCQDDPYDIEIELGDPVEAEGSWYFSTYTVIDDEEIPEEQLEAMEQADGGQVNVPAAAE